MPSHDYPPAFSQNAISTVIGHVGDFAGNDSSSSSEHHSHSHRHHASAARLASSGSSLDGGAPDIDGDSSVPVVITGSRPPTAPHFPGLREAMLGSAIYQLAEQVPAGNPLATKIKALAEELHRYGAQKILDSKVTSNQPTHAPAAASGKKSGKGRGR